ncbi:M4 family metallopeptidase [Streptomyces sp. NPDC050504]|uniref:M4 family metallopeptidase n=1 Tax=Streptomyces sp. NPDC050504 TaxID=3365618 RepID=UPI003787B2FB
MRKHKTVRRGISGAAALLGATALAVTALPAQAATTAAPVPPGDIVPGTETATPALVDGLREAVDAKAAPADAARGHLAAKESRYKIEDARGDLVPLRTTVRGAEETVRLQQRHKGVPVLGGQYVVRMEKKAGKRVVTGTSGKYFTGLTADTTPKVSEDLAVRRAVSATAARLGATKSLSKADAVRKEGAKSAKAAALSGTAAGLVVVPRGEGVLTYQVTVRGTHPITGAPVIQQVYVDADAGYPVLQYSGIKTIGAPHAAQGRAKAAARTKADRTRAGLGAVADSPSIEGEGTLLSGAKVPLNLYYNKSKGAYDLIDYARMAGTSKNALTTWDARGRDVSEVSGRWPSGLKEFTSPALELGKEHTESGAVDAHWAAGEVYDFYKDRLGRDGLDGRGMTVNSLVGVTEFGQGYVNAFWDGQKMVYGSGDEEYKPLSADLDVVGHEMTHGVVEHTANLVYAGQSGALNEAVADYFGNAIDVEASGIPMSDPASGFIGEDLCRTTKPADCAFRNLNDGRTTSKTFLGTTFDDGDNGAVHRNSTIFSGALWDIRQDLGDTVLADRVVYKALADYMTPLDGFTEARNAVIAAAKDLNFTAKQLNVVKRSFNTHGIVPGWEEALGVDTDTLLGSVNTSGTGLGAGGGWWAASQSNDDGSEPYSVYAGRTDGAGAPKLISPNDGRYHVYPATDGKTVVWAAYGTTSVDVLSRRITGGPTTKLYTAYANVQGLRVENGVVVLETSDPFGGRHVGYLKPGDREPTWVDGGKYYLGTALPSIKNGKIAYAKLYPGTTDYLLGTEVYDLATKKTALAGQLGEPQSIGQTAINGSNVFWTVDENPNDEGQVAVRRAKLNGTEPSDISSEHKSDALYGYELTASDEAVTVASTTPDTVYRNETLSKLWQIAPDGSSKVRFSCNRGEQLWPTAAGGTQVVWLDGTTGRTNLVTRERPADACN